MFYKVIIFFLIFDNKCGLALFWELATEEVMKVCDLAICAPSAALKEKKGL